MDTQQAQSIRNAHKICIMKPKTRQGTMEDLGIDGTIIIQ
jgi:hypothetical protein